MTVRALGVVVALAISPLGAWAQSTGSVGVPAGVAVDVAALTEVLKIGSVIDVMREEGIAYGAEMESDMFTGQGGARWQAAVAAIYDPAELRRQFDAALGQALAGSPETAAIAAFFGSDLGQRILTLEIAARRALLDDVAEEAAKLSYAEMAAGAEPRVAALEAFVATNDLIESNVTGALNANLAFYQGLADVGGSAGGMPQDQMLAEVWAQEPDMRAETVDWLYPYLALAYKPLTDAELATYQAFSDSAAGQAVNAALFSAFDAMFIDVSRKLGRAAAMQMMSQDL